jgi:hypothetical protein
MYWLAHAVISGQLVTSAAHTTSAGADVQSATQGVSSERREQDSSTGLLGTQDVALLLHLGRHYSQLPASTAHTAAAVLCYEHAVGVLRQRQQQQQEAAAAPDGEGASNQAGSDTQQLSLLQEAIAGLEAARSRQV